MTKNNFAVALIISLFFLWGFALNLNPILIPHLKKACQLTDTQSGFVDSASYIAYFLLAIPAGKIMSRYGYKAGIVIGLLLFAIGAFLFYPAASTRSYVFFLAALFIIASGLAFLETAANPYITVLGDQEGAARRINFAQSFNGLAATLAPLLGGLFILSGETISPEQEAQMSPAQMEAYLNMEATSVQIPFLIIGAVVLLVAFFVMRVPLPEIEEQAQESEHEGSLLKNKNLMFGATAEFFYVGAQACICGFFIRFSEQVAGIPEKPAAMYLSGALLGFMAGRFIGTFLMKYIAPAKLLAIYSFINIILVIAAVTLDGYPAVYALVGILFFMSIMFPTIFSLSIRGLGSKTKEGSSYLIMAIVGGAFFPVVMGKVSDMTNMQLAYIIPIFAFIVIFFFAMKNLSAKGVSLVQGH